MSAHWMGGDNEKLKLAALTSDSALDSKIVAREIHGARGYSGAISPLLRIKDSYVVGSADRRIVKAVWL
jgi:hypothetical protein